MEVTIRTKQNNTCQCLHRACNSKDSTKSLALPITIPSSQIRKQAQPAQGPMGSKNWTWVHMWFWAQSPSLCTMKRKIKVTQSIALSGETHCCAPEFSLCIYHWCGSFLGAIGVPKYHRLCLHLLAKERDLRLCLGQIWWVRTACVSFLHPHSLFHNEIGHMKSHWKRVLSFIH